MLTQFISDFAIRCLDTAGYAGAAFLMALESMIAPIPSEAVMPFVGFLVADGKWSLGAGSVGHQHGVTGWFTDFLLHGILWRETGGAQGG